MSNRSNFVIAMIGTNGTGKSTITKELILKWKQSRPDGKVICFDYQQQFQYGTYSDFYIQMGDPAWAVQVNQKVKNSLIVLDDYKLLLPNYTPTAGFRDLFINRRINNNDIIISCHSPANIIDELTYYITHYYIFFTMAIEGKFKEKLPFAYMVVAASNMVNKYVSVNGKGIHPQHKDYKGQTFPYIIVNTESGKLQPMNFSKKFINENLR